jgi:chromosome segregation ATPase
MDSTSLVRIADTFLVQLENICNLPTPEDLVKQYEAAIERETFLLEEMRNKRDSAVSDGEVHVAEELCYQTISGLEKTLSQVVSKAETLEKALEQNIVFVNVSAQFHQKTPEEFNRIVTKCTKLRQRCVEDIQKMFSLREKVEEVEAKTAAKVQKEREESDAVLAKNQKRLDEVFAAIEALEREAESLERERHKEYAKRLTEKDKDEHRRAEFARFCSVVDEHLVPLERTAKNMDLMISATEAMRTLIDNSFQTIADDLTKRQKLLSEIKIESHKEHVEVFRGLLIELGEIIYRKERMVEETEKKIQQAHVQQELLAETFNPNAKKFGDIKKTLLKNRDDLEADIQELKERAASGIAQFSASEKALNAAQVPFVHPVTEQEHHTLALKAKMLEFKAMLLGHTDHHPVVAEIEDLKRQVQDAAESISATNSDTTGVILKALPMIRAASRARFQQAT